MFDSAALQRYLRHSASLGHDRIAVAPFSLYIAPDGAPDEASYAIPDEGIENASPDQLRAAAARIRELCTEHRVRTRFEWLEPTAPRLEEGLRALGFACERRAPLMTCSHVPATAPQVPLLGELEFIEVPADAPADRVELLLRTVYEGFGFGEPSTGEIAGYPDTTGRGCGIVVVHEGRPVAAGSFTEPRLGFAEIGLATLAAHRRQGLATVLTRELTERALARGAETIFLTPGDDGSRRIYARAGYERTADLLAYRDPE